MLDFLKFAAIIPVGLCAELIYAALVMIFYVLCMMICYIILYLDWIFDIYDRIVDDKDIYRVTCQPYQVKVPDNSRWKYHTVWKYRMITKPAFRHIAKVVTDALWYDAFMTYDIDEMYMWLPENTYTILDDAHGHGYLTKKEAWAAYLATIARKQEAMA